MAAKNDRAMRTAFYRQNPNPSPGVYYRLDFNGERFLARVNFGKRNAAPIYLLYVTGLRGGGLDMAHLMLGEDCVLRANGLTSVSQKVQAEWDRLVGLTSSEHKLIKDLSDKGYAIDGETLRLFQLYETTKEKA